MTFIEHIQALRAKGLLSVWNSDKFTNEERFKLRNRIMFTDYPFKEIIIEGLKVK
jgi:hypothetical protein